MKSYKWKIIYENNKYIFIIYPNNSNTQEIGRSSEYNSEKECLEAFKNFKKFIIENKINSSKSEHIVTKKYENKVLFEYADEDKTIFFGRCLYWQKQSEKDIINSLYEHLLNGKIKFIK